MGHKNIMENKKESGNELVELMVGNQIHHNINHIKFIREEIVRAFNVQCINKELILTFIEELKLSKHTF